MALRIPTVATDLLVQRFLKHADTSAKQTNMTSLHQQIGAAMLPQGITGFWMDGGQPPPSVSKKSVLAVAHSSAREIGQAVVTTNWATHNNFHVVEISGCQSKLTMLFNAQYPVVGLAEALLPNDHRIVFQDHAALASAVSTTSEFLVLSADELRRPVTSKDLDKLNSAELQQVEYWKPATVGELVFNFRD